MTAAALSNRQRRLLVKSIPKPPRHARPADGAVASVARVRREPEDSLDRDGLEWLERKGRLSQPQLEAARYARGVIRAVEGPSLRSCLDVQISGSGQVGGLAPAEISAGAKLELFTLKWVVLGGQDDLWTVVEGVCGGGLTLRALAGPGSADQVKDRAKVLEKVLTIALDLVAHHRASG